MMDFLIDGVPVLSAAGAAAELDMTPEQVEAMCRDGEWVARTGATPIPPNAASWKPTWHVPRDSILVFKRPQALV